MSQSIRVKLGAVLSEFSTKAEADSLRIPSVRNISPFCPNHATNMPDIDELAEIDGIRPNVELADGEEQEVKSLTRFMFRSFVSCLCSCVPLRLALQ